MGKTNNTFLLFILYAAVLVLNQGCTKSTHSLNTDPSETIQLCSLWDNKVSPVLKLNVWDGNKEQLLDSPYQVCNFLMVPMQAAFILNNEKWIADIDDHVANFLANQQNFESNFNNLHKLKYLYLLSQYLTLTNGSENNRTLYNYILAFIIDYWMSPAWMWAREDFDNVPDRINYKLALKDPAKSYFKGITDHELFAFSIAADLVFVSNKYESSVNTTVLEIINLAYLVYSQEGNDLPGDRWLFQNGVWRDHPDYSFDSHEENISWDSSHFHRFPLWIRSLKNAFSTQDSIKEQYFSNIQRNLANQFHSVTLSHPNTATPFYKLCNFMDGSNGTYRDIYGPFELSGTLLLGWWCFLESGQEYQLYSSLIDQFPFSEQFQDIYLGSKKKNGTFDENLVLYSDREIIVRLAKEIAF